MLVRGKPFSIFYVPPTGLEPAQPQGLKHFKCFVSTNSTMRATNYYDQLFQCSILNVNVYSTFDVPYIVRYTYPIYGIYHSGRAYIHHLRSHCSNNRFHRIDVLE